MTWDQVEWANNALYINNTLAQTIPSRHQRTIPQTLHPSPHQTTIPNKTTTSTPPTPHAHTHAKSSHCSSFPNIPTTTQGPQPHLRAKYAQNVKIYPTRSLLSLHHIFVVHATLQVHITPTPSRSIHSKAHNVLCGIHRNNSQRAGFCGA